MARDFRGIVTRRAGMGLAALALWSSSSLSGGVHVLPTDENPALKVWRGDWYRLFCSIYLNRKDDREIKNSNNC